MIQELMRPCQDLALRVEVIQTRWGSLVDQSLHTFSISCVTVMDLMWCIKVIRILSLCANLGRLAAMLHGLWLGVPVVPELVNLWTTSRVSVSSTLLVAKGRFA